MTFDRNALIASGPAIPEQHDLATIDVVLRVLLLVEVWGAAKVSASPGKVSTEKIPNVTRKSSANHGNTPWFIVNQIN